MKQTRSTAEYCLDNQNIIRNKGNFFFMWNFKLEYSEKWIKLNKFEVIVIQMICWISR